MLYIQDDRYFGSLYGLETHDKRKKCQKLIFFRSKTLLHLAAEGFKQRENLHITTRKRDFVEIARVLLERDPGLVYVTTHRGQRKKTPVELALENYDDEMASLLMNKMAKKSRYG